MDWNLYAATSDLAIPKRVRVLGIERQTCQVSQVDRLTELADLSHRRTLLEALDIAKVFQETGPGRANSGHTSNGHLTLMIRLQNFGDDTAAFDELPFVVCKSSELAKGIDGLRVATDHAT